jgi:serine/threonine-protein kinase
MSQSTTPPLGGRYELRRQLATTPAARVYLAQDLELDRPVAIKVLGPDLARDPAIVAKFRQAASSAAAVHDPRIVTIYDWGEDKGAVYVAMEYVEGASLAETLSTARRLGVAPTINMGVKVAGALDAAHQAGLVHGSLKPRDVLMAREGTVKVTDFGTATAGLASLAGPVSNATYDSPEQLQGQAPDARSDLYALGILLYESLTGAPPFSGPDAVAITQRKLSERALPPSVSLPGIPPGFDAIIDRLLERDPQRRYATGNEVATDLIRLGETAQVPVVGDPTQAVPAVAATAAMPRTVAPVPPPIDDDDEKKKRSATPWIIAAIVIIVLALGGLAAWAFTKDDEGKKQMVQVPAVVGARQADAIATLEAAGLSPSASPEPSDSFAKGIVFSQAPNGGTQARKNSVVVIKVSAGPTTTTTSSTSTSTSTSTSSTTTSTSTTTTTTTTTAPPNTTPTT